MPSVASNDALQCAAENRSCIALSCDAHHDLYLFFILYTWSAMLSRLLSGSPSISRSVSPCT